MKKPYDYIVEIANKFDMNDSEVAQELGVSRQAVSNYKKSDVQKGFDNKVALKVAKMLDIDPLVVIADMEIHKAKTKEELKFWKRLGSVAVIIFCLTLSPQTVVRDEINGNLTNVPLYIMRNVVAIARKLLRSMARFMRNVLFDSLMESNAINNG